MYSHGSICFPILYANRFNFQVHSVSPIGADVWFRGHILPKHFANRVNFQVDSVGPIGADVWPWGHIIY